MNVFVLVFCSLANSHISTNNMSSMSCSSETHTVPLFLCYHLIVDQEFQHVAVQEKNFDYKHLCLIPKFKRMSQVLALAVIFIIDFD